MRGVGIDCLSVERFGWKEPAVHRVLLSSGIFIIESLSNEVKRFIGKRFFLLALPIKIGRGDGAPVRAIGIPERD